MAVEPAVGGYERVLEGVDHFRAASGVEADLRQVRRASARGYPARLCLAREVNQSVELFEELGIRRKKAILASPPLMRLTSVRFREADSRFGVAPTPVSQERNALGRYEDIVQAAAT